MALSAFILGGMPAAFGYAPNAVLTPAAICGIMSINTIIPAVLALVMGLMGLGGPIDNHECFRQASETVVTQGASAASSYVSAIL